MEIEANGTYDLITNGVQRVPVTINVVAGNVQAAKDVTITSNTTTTVVPDEGYDSMSTVVVDTKVSTQLYQFNNVVISEDTVLTAPESREVVVPANNIILFSVPNDNVLYLARAGSSNVTVLDLDKYIITGYDIANPPYYTKLRITSSGSTHDFLNIPTEYVPVYNQEIPGLKINPSYVNIDITPFLSN